MNSRLDAEQSVKILFASCSCVDCLVNSDDVDVYYFHPGDLRHIPLICNILSLNGIKYDFHNTHYYKYRGLSRNKKLVVRVEHHDLRQKQDFYNIFREYREQKKGKNIQQLQIEQIPLLFPLFTESRKIAVMNKIADNIR